MRSISASTIAPNGKSAGAAWKPPMPDLIHRAADQHSSGNRKLVGIIDDTVDHMRG
jgi:hypothetical protein